MTIMRKTCIRYSSNDITSTIYAITIIVCYSTWVFKKMYVSYSLYMHCLIKIFPSEEYITRFSFYSILIIKYLF